MEFFFLWLRYCDDQSKIRNIFGHVLKPETTKRSERNETPETTETSETKTPKQTERNHRNKRNETTETSETTKTKTRYDKYDTKRPKQLHHEPLKDRIIWPENTDPRSVGPPTDPVHGLPYGPVHGPLLRTPLRTTPKSSRKRKDHERPVCFACAICSAQAPAFAITNSTQASRKTTRLVSSLVAAMDDRWEFVNIN